MPDPRWRRARTRRAGASFAKVGSSTQNDSTSRAKGKMPLHRQVLNGVVASVQTRLKTFDYFAPQGRVNSSQEESVDRYSCGFALQEGSGEAYNEEAFQYFLEIERKRSEISNRPFLLMLIEFERQEGTDARIDPAMAAKLFSVLSLCLRETDFVGWYREERVVGAVLTQHSETDGD